MLVSMQAGLQSLRRTPPAVLTYATWNPSDKNAGITLSNGNLTAAGAVGVRATISKSSGKWYWEVNCDTRGSANSMEIGVATGAVSLASRLGTFTGAWIWRSDSTYVEQTNSTSGIKFTTGDRIMIAIDLGAGKVWFGKNGTWNASGDPGAGTNPIFTTLSGTVFPAMSVQNSTGSPQATANFGATTLTYSVPSGFNSGVYS